MTYDDEREGCMRTHVAATRSDLLIRRYDHEALRRHAYAHGLSGSKDKAELAWRLTVNGLVDADGALRSGWPT